MIYKEIQVPSETIKEVYGDIKAKLEKVFGDANELHAQNEKIYREFWNESDRRDRIAQKNYPKAHMNYMHYGEGYFALYSRMHDHPENAVKKLMNLCEDALSAAGIGETLTMTEDQVKKFNWHRSGKSLENALKWLSDRKSPVPDKYPVPDWMLTPPQPPKPKVVTEQPKEPKIDLESLGKVDHKEVTHKEPSNPFWMGFIGTLALILLAIFGISLF